MGRSPTGINGGLCSVVDCARNAACKGMCHAHYTRWRRHGSINQDSLHIQEKRFVSPPYTQVDEETACIELTRGYLAIVDIEDAERINQFLWAANVRVSNDGAIYVRALRTFRGFAIYMHHQVLELMPWQISPKEIDHEDRNPLNNKRENLKIVTHAQNMANSKYAGTGLGVTYNSKANLWMVYLDSPGEKRKYLGYTRTREEGLARVEAARC